MIILLYYITYYIIIYLSYSGTSGASTDASTRNIRPPHDTCKPTWNPERKIRRCENCIFASLNVNLTSEAQKHTQHMFFLFCTEARCATAQNQKAHQNLTKTIVGGRVHFVFLLDLKIFIGLYLLALLALLVAYPGPWGIGASQIIISYNTI